MTPEQFTYWLQGFFEITENPTLSPKQIKIIKDHLELVFDKKTPSYKQPNTTQPMWQEPHITNPPYTPPVPPYTITCEDNSNDLFCKKIC